jgi:hypothetical protein
MTISKAESDGEKIKSCVFVHLPRTGGTSIGQYLLEQDIPIVRFGKNTVNSHCSTGCCSRDMKLLSVIQEPFFFGFIRNPWDWYVSRYFYFTVIRWHLQERGCRESGLRCDPPLSFRDHLLANTENDWFWLTHRYRHLFCDDDGKLLLHYVGRQEHIGKSLDEVFSMRGFTPSMGYDEWDANNKTKRNASPHNHYSEYYDEELIRLIAQKDKSLINTYNYEF